MSRRPKIRFSGSPDVISSPTLLKRGRHTMEADALGRKTLYAKCITNPLYGLKVGSSLWRARSIPLQDSVIAKSLASPRHSRRKTIRPPCEAVAYSYS
jgi:hypothetical protein